jgi:hypothetical protein
MTIIVDILPSVFMYKIGTVFEDAMPCSLVEMYQRFRGTCSSHTIFVAGCFIHALSVKTI